MRRALLFAGTLALAGGLTVADVRLASPASVTLQATRTDRPIPRDPWAPVWKRATAVEIPLSAQITTRPIGGRDGMVIARAVHDGERLYVLLEWKDHTRDLSAGGSEQFADQAAVEFPTENGERIPFFCMGDPQATVNIWLWKGSRQADIDHGYRDVEQTHPDAVSDAYPFEEDPTFYPPRALGNVVGSVGSTPVESLLAGGFGSLTQFDPQEVGGVGRWRDSSWRVLFVRRLAAPADGQTQFDVPHRTSIAFAVWNGAAKERNGQKSVSQFVSLDISEQALGKPASRPPAALIAALAILLVAGLAGTPLLFARLGATKASRHGIPG